MGRIGRRCRPNSRVAYPDANVLKEVLSLPPTRNLPSWEQILEESKAFGRAIYAALLTVDQRAVFNAREGAGQKLTMAQLGEVIGMDADKVHSTETSIRAKVERVLSRLANEGGHDFKARDFLLGRFFPTLLRNEHEREIQFAKLAKAGIIFTDDGNIDLSNLDNEAFCKTSFVTTSSRRVLGVNLLRTRSTEERPIKTAEDLFQRGDFVEGFIVPPREKSSEKGDLNFQNRVSLETLRSFARNPINITTLKEEFGIHLRKDGKWHIAIRTKHFEKAWFFVGEGQPLMGGRGISRILDEKHGQPSIKKFFELVFGAGSIHFVQGKRGGKRHAERAGERFIPELRSKKNISNWMQAGVVFNDEGVAQACDICVTVKQFRRMINFDIDGSEVSGEFVLDKKGFPIAREGIEQLCNMIFPGVPVNFKVTFNEVPLREMDLSRESIFEQLRTHGNLKNLAERAIFWGDGRLLLAKMEKDGQLRPLDYFAGDFTGLKVNVFSREVGPVTLLGLLGRGRGKSDIVGMYTDIFGASNILTLDNVDIETFTANTTCVDIWPGGDKNSYGDEAICSGSA